jgi:aminoglycoside phosphotransferase
MIAALGSRPRLVRSARGGVPGAAVRAALAAGDWRCERALPTVSDTAVVMVRTSDGSSGLLKLAVSPHGTGSLRGEREILGLLQAKERLAGWRELIPKPLGWGNIEGTEYLLTSRLPGRDGRRLPAAGPGTLTPAAFGAIAPLHRQSQTVVGLDGALLDDWVEQPMALLRDTVRPRGETSRAVDRIGVLLRAGLAGAQVRLGWTHGDFHPGNVLVGGDGQVTGIVDWDQARERDITATDLAFWLLTVPSPGRRQEFGGRVAARLGRHECWTPAEKRLLGTAGGSAETGRALLLLAWLRHVAGNLAKSSRYAASPLWSRRNIRPVLRQVAGE